MSDQILNVLTQILIYADPTVTDNPHQRSTDWRRRAESLSVKNPYSNVKTLAPGQSFSIFDGIIASGLTGSSVMAISLLSAQDSLYRLSVTSGPSSFKTARSPSGITACNVTINNNAIAEFDFTGATLTGVIVGDILRVKGQVNNDSGPYAFNSLNAGIWKIIAVSGSKVSCVRMPNEVFQAAVELVAAATADVQFYADDGIAVGSKMAIESAFSAVSQKTYEVKAVTPTTIDFVSTSSIPLESNVSYTSNSVIFYTSSKKLVYVEVDQDCVIRLNGASDDSNKLNPIEAGNSMLPGFMHKWGNTFKCEVINKSVNSCTVRFITCE